MEFEIFNIIWRSLPYLLKGTLVTIELTFGFLAVGFIVGIPIAFLQTYGNHRIFNMFISPYLLFFRGVPELVLLFLFYFGTAHININVSPFIAVILALGLRSAAFQSQIFRGAIQSIPDGQFMAARSIGMSKFKAVKNIILPQALRLSIPPWSNEYTIVLKQSSLAYAVGVTELMRQGRYIVARTFGNALIVYLVCALVYFILVTWGIKILYFFEKKFRIPGYEIKEASGRANGRL
ncbi:amino acid ABC transporter permease [Thermodesulfobacteriota bacterium]